MAVGNIDGAVDATAAHERSVLTAQITESNPVTVDDDHRVVPGNGSQLQPDFAIVRPPENVLAFFERVPTLSDHHLEGRLCEVAHLLNGGYESVASSWNRVHVLGI